MKSENIRFDREAPFESRQAHRTRTSVLAAIAVMAVFAVIFAFGQGDHAGVSADAGGCKVTTGTWSVDAGVVHVDGDISGTVEQVNFTLGNIDFPIAEWVGDEIVHTSGGDLFASQVGTFNLVTGEVEFVATFEGGTRRWAGATGQQHVVGVDQVGGTSSGDVCVGKSDWDNGHRQNS